MAQIATRLARGNLGKMPGGSCDVEAMKHAGEASLNPNR